MGGKLPGGIKANKASSIRKNGRPKKGSERTIDDCKKALKKYSGFIRLAADSLGISDASLSTRIKRTPELQVFLDSLKDGVLLEVEDLFMENVRAGDKACQMFFLKCHGKSRGWIERTEIDLGLQKIVRIERKKFDGE